MKGNDSVSAPCYSYSFLPAQKNSGKIPCVTALNPKRGQLFEGGFLITIPTCDNFPAIKNNRNFSIYASVGSEVLDRVWSVAQNGKDF